jgi:hypothetical protein
MMVQSSAGHSHYIPTYASPSICTAVIPPVVRAGCVRAYAGGAKRATLPTGTRVGVSDPQRDQLADRQPPELINQQYTPYLQRRAQPPLVQLAHTALVLRGSPAPPSRAQPATRNIRTHHCAVPASSRSPQPSASPPPPRSKRALVWQTLRRCESTELTGCLFTGDAMHVSHPTLLPAVVGHRSTSRLSPHRGSP